MAHGFENIYEHRYESAKLRFNLGFNKPNFPIRMTVTVTKEPKGKSVEIKEKISRKERKFHP